MTHYFARPVVAKSDKERRFDMDTEIYEKYADKIYTAIQGTPTRNRGTDTVKQLIIAQLIQMTMEMAESE
jgi:hypothetical protein